MTALPEWQQWNQSKHTRNGFIWALTNRKRANQQNEEQSSFKKENIEQAIITGTLKRNLGDQKLTVKPLSTRNFPILKSFELSGETRQKQSSLKMLGEAETAFPRPTQGRNYLQSCHWKSPKRTLKFLSKSWRVLRRTRQISSKRNLISIETISRKIGQISMDISQISCKSSQIPSKSNKIASKSSQSSSKSSQTSTDWSQVSSESSQISEIYTSFSVSSLWWVPVIVLTVLNIASLGYGVVALLLAVGIVAIWNAATAALLSQVLFVLHAPILEPSFHLIIIAMLWFLPKKK